MCVSTHQRLIMANKNKIPKTSQFITCVGDDTCLGRLDGGPSGCRQIDAIIVETFTLYAEPGNQAPLYGPYEPTAGFRRQLW